MTELEGEAFFRRVRRKDRETAKVALILFLAVSALGIYLFWFRV